MTASGNIEVTVRPRIYGASELGVLAITAPGDAHPRVEHIGAELFIGLGDANDGSALTQGQAAVADRSTREDIVAATAAAGAVREPSGGLLVIDDEVLASAVLLDPALIDTAPLDGAPVLFALARDLVLVVGMNDEAAMTRVLDLAEERYEAGGPLVSSHPVIAENGAWVPFPWIQRVPQLEMRIQRVLRLFAVRAYEAQTRALRRPDVMLVDPKIHVLDTGVTTTFATWVKGVATLLPVADNVILADRSSEGTQLSVTGFSAFLDAAGAAVIRTGLSPLRYFVPGEPPQASPER